MIVPVYNVETWLPRCLDSLLIQGLSGYEVIAVNDGSTDSSGGILNSYCEKWPELLQLIETPNGGLGHARNCGLEAAKGEFVVFVDSDDWLAPGAVKEMLELLETAAESADIVVYDYVHVDENGTELEKFSGCRLDRTFSYAEEPEFLFSAHNAWNKLWRKSLFTEHAIRFPDRLWFEDLATTPKLCLHSSCILPIHRTWYCYLQRNGSIMGNTSPEKIKRNEEMISVADIVLNYYRDMGAYDRFLPQLEYKFFYEEYLAAVNRINRIDPASPLQAKVRDDFLERFPNYRDNRYVRSAPPKYRLLDRLIRSGNWGAVHILMGFKSKMKGR